MMARTRITKPWKDKAKIIKNAFHRYYGIVNNGSCFRKGIEERWRYVYEMVEGAWNNGELGLRPGEVPKDDDPSKSGSGSGSGSGPSGSASGPSGSSPSGPSGSGPSGSGPSGSGPSGSGPSGQTASGSMSGSGQTGASGAGSSPGGSPKVKMFSRAKRAAIVGGRHGKNVNVGANVFYTCISIHIKTSNQKISSGGHSVQ